MHHNCKERAAHKVINVTCVYLNYIVLTIILYELSCSDITCKKHQVFDLFLREKLGSVLKVIIVLQYYFLHI